jgi:hypothetical protein
MVEGIGKLETTHIFVGFGFYLFINDMPQESNFSSPKTTFYQVQFYVNKP